jgi:hypothetical protein
MQFIEEFFLKEPFVWMPENTEEKVDSFEEFVERVLSPILHLHYQCLWESIVDVSQH